ncbi:MAG: DUF1934 domain-containing protein [Clostridia bacterium]|nr:DUF1934 domain-containing protein [Clostridia bacterium]MBQ3078115.1 DUF1934 domain-containing protein [Clostridia bacterium]
MKRKPDIVFKRKENNAMITIKGRQYYDDEYYDTIELMTDGSFEKQGDAYLISYDESEVTGMTGTRTTILVEPGDRVTLTRVGGVCQSLIFEPGRRNNGHYVMNEGQMTLTVDAGRVVNRLSEKGGSLFVNYSLEINSQLMSKNNFLIKIKEEPPYGPICQGWPGNGGYGNA